MGIEKAYDQWVGQYDTNENKTRDLDKEVTIEVLSRYDFNSVLEPGCGTGKNTEWLMTKAAHVTCLDFSEGMLAKAREKVKSANVRFQRADLNEAWPVPDGKFDLVTFNLVLEHIKDLDAIFAQVWKKLQAGGKFFISELHPFRQYTGSKAKFETAQGTLELEVYIHHVSEFTSSAIRNGFTLLELKEWFDADNAQALPRLISFVFEKQSI